MNWDDMALVGRIARPHGLRGHVVVIPETDFVEARFAPGSVVWRQQASGALEPLTIASARVQRGRPIVGFQGVENIDEAALLAGTELRVPEEALQPLEPGQYYAHQLVGCAVELVAGGGLGTVTRVEGGIGGSRLVIDGARGEILVPLAAGICVEIDVAARRIRIEPPEGLLDLNETKRSRASGVGRTAR